MFTGKLASALTARGCIKMIFSDIELVKKIISGEKTTTIRLKKKGERYKTKARQGPVNAVVNDLTERKRWQVGKSVSVQLKREGKGIWFCPDCKKISQEEDNDFSRFCGGGKYIPLRLTIKSIQEMNLRDVTEEMAKQDGFERKIDFIRYFCKVNKIKLHAQHPQIPIGQEFWTDNLHCSIEKNPKVWRLSFYLKDGK